MVQSAQLLPAMASKYPSYRRRWCSVAINLCVVLVFIGGNIDPSFAFGSKNQVKRIYDRIAGVPANEQELQQMLQAGSLQEAAEVPLSTTYFYDVTLKNMAAPWTNEEQTAFVELNDYTATVIGLVRDNIDFRQVLYADLLYIGNSQLVPGLPSYSLSNNDHYVALEESGVSLREGLVQATQSSEAGFPTDATAGVMTTRAAGKAFFSAGTNRAMLRFTLMNHLCRDLEQFKDTSRPADRIRQDVSRSPGGDSRIFLNNCVACHNGMDPLAQAYAYYEYAYDMDNDPTGINGTLLYNSEGQTDPTTGTRVWGKYHINANNFPFGYVTTNDSWVNYWRAGPNAVIGWANDLGGSGAGAKTLGTELAHSEAFAQCQVQKVFRTVCLRDPSEASDVSAIDNITGSFKASGYNLKTAFAETAGYCMGVE